jgi:thiamine transport system ATP-binding protein
MTGALDVTNLRVSFGEVVAVDDVTFTLEHGEVLAVLGPSGCGKSTLLRAIAGLERVDGGSVAFDGQDLAAVPTFRRGFALMFQDGQLFPHLSVADNVAYPLRLRRVPRADRQARVDELLDLVGLPGAHHQAPGTLSGGEAQRVALARALAVRPRLLLLDEPLSALDRDLRDRLAVELRDILHAQGTTALLVTHDHDEAFAVADRMAVMRAGRFVQSGTLEDVWRAPADPETARFLGYAAVLDGEAARRLVAVAGAGDPRSGAPLALRRSALRLDPRGPLRATVRAVRTTPEVTRLVVQLTEPTGLGELDAVAPLGIPVAVGEQVGLELDLARTSSLPGGRDDLHAPQPGNGSATVGTGP